MNEARDILRTPFKDFMENAPIDRGRKKPKSNIWEALHNLMRQEFPEEEWTVEHALYFSEKTLRSRRNVGDISIAWWKETLAENGLELKEE